MMGTIISKDTRRISFDNTISMNPILIKKTITDSDELNVEYFDVCINRNFCTLTYNFLLVYFYNQTKLQPKAITIGK